MIYDLHVLQLEELQWLLMEDWNVAGKYMTFVFNCSWKMNDVMQVFLFFKVLHKLCERFYVFTTLFVQHSLTIGVRFLVSLGSVRDKCNGRLALVSMLFLKHGLISMTCHLGQKSVGFLVMLENIFYFFKVTFSKIFVYFYCIVGRANNSCAVN